VADGEGIVEEVIARLRWVVVGEKETIDSSKRVQAGIKSFAEETLKIYKQMSPAELQKQIGIWKETKRPIEEVVATLRQLGKTTPQIKAALSEAGYTTRQFNKALGETAGAGKKVDWSLRGIGQSVQWAAYRFLFALGIYMLFRKAIRLVNEAIQESIRLFRELSKAQQTLRANLEMNLRIVGDSVGTLEEWNGWIKETQKSWRTTSQAILDAANNALQANATLKMSAAELQDVIELGRAVAIMYGEYKDGQLDVAKGVEIVTDAMAGQQSAMNQLGFTLRDVTRYAGMTNEEFNQLPDAMQASIIRAYIMSERFDDISESAQASTHGVEAFASTLDAAIAEEKANLGGLATFFSKLPGMIELVILKIVDFAIEWETKLNAAFRMTLVIIQAIMAQAGVAVNIQNDLSDASKDNADETLRVAAAWQMIQAAANKAKEIASKTKRIFKNVMGLEQRAMETIQQAAEDAAAEWERLGKTVSDTIRSYQEDVLKAQEDFNKDYADTFKEQREDEEDINKRYDKKAADLRKRALDKIAKLRKKAAQDEKDDRADLNLRLKHMEEDHLLDMKHLREQFTMDLEEAARKRDAVAMRTIQRRYGLERRQREEAYQLQRRQTVEAWDQDQKERQRDLNDEINEIRKALAEELAELRAEKREELAEIRANWDERRAELTKQYNQELADLKTALGRRLAEGISEWANQNNIPLETVKKVVMALAEQYGMDADNLWNNLVLPEMQMLEQLRQAWATVMAAAAGTPTTPVVPTAPIQGGTHGLQGGISQLQFAEGGMALATSPTTVKVGEAGPELFGAIPLGKLGTGAMGLRGGADIRLTIDGTQSGAWSGDFETQVLRVLRGVLQESL
jgi:hypothetical protein